MIERLDLIEKRYEEINNLLMQNEIISDIKKSRELSIELSSIEEVVKKYREYKKVLSDISESKEMLHDSEIADFAKEKIVILSTHIVSDVEYISDFILLMKDGSLILTGKTQDLASSLEGRVWSFRIPETQLDQIIERNIVVNLRHDDPETVEVRIVSDEKPLQDAVLKKPTLEDLYLFHFQEYRNERGAEKDV